MNERVLQRLSLTTGSVPSRMRVHPKQDAYILTFPLKNGRTVRVYLGLGDMLVEAHEADAQLLRGVEEVIGVDPWI